MPPKKIQDEQEVVRWFVEGRTYEWMQQTYRDKYGIDTSIPMWSAFRRRRGIDRRNLRDDNLLPWKINEKHRYLYPAMMLRTEARLRAGKELTARDGQRLARWNAMLTDGRLVVHYDASTERGWFYVPREESDSDIIRRPNLADGNRAAD
ncbi:hypothetical protein ACIGBL_34905 [Streptomyces sp. NPDC085614]|uniref:hypothetical protein n=1 Tax=Streptomyces sp. NPDC085614 TaxID=3365733 RepID=UPI0037D3497E